MRLLFFFCFFGGGGGGGGGGGILIKLNNAISSVLFESRNEIRPVCRHSSLQKEILRHDNTRIHVGNFSIYYSPRSKTHSSAISPNGSPDDSMKHLGDKQVER